MSPDDASPPQLRDLPAVDAVLKRLPADARAADLVRSELDALREALRTGRHSGAVPDERVVAERVGERLSRADRPAYPRVVNATGVFLHTGLGRAALPRAAREALLEQASGFTVLEVDPETGGRKDRESRLLDDLCALTGAESATVVNNNAGALLLALTALAQTKDVLVSRGQLIEIGGGFRLPDLLAQSGARLVEVGTTNRTYASDFDARLTWETGMLLVMHTSNYRVVGFTAEPSVAELATLARVQGVPVLVDVGSGVLAPPPPTLGLDHEPDVRTALRDGADLVCFSGDKLLGGPQAGVLVGRADLVRRCRRHPLFRALRPDRLALAALSATLAAHRRAPLDEIPVLAALARTPETRRAHAERLAAALGARFPLAKFDVVASEGAAGSGSAPARPLASWAVEVTWPRLAAGELAHRLRTGDVPVFGRVADDRLRLDVFALLDGDEAQIALAFAALPRDGDGP
ncbi:MAG: L-seryl-tRNA(Sec) selenium transferase [Planctomycetes bacterium]|nr:L-seryl-tRNA(Sec) selenium transferase [Planctomycetota bacterium]